MREMTRSSSSIDDSMSTADILTDRIRDSVREVVQDELSLMRRDLSFILRAELTSSKASPSRISPWFQRKSTSGAGLIPNTVGSITSSNAGETSEAVSRPPTRCSQAASVRRSLSGRSIDKPGHGRIVQILDVDDEPEPPPMAAQDAPCGRMAPQASFDPGAESHHFQPRHTRHTKVTWDEKCREQSQATSFSENRDTWAMTQEQSKKQKLDEELEAFRPRSMAQPDGGCMARLLALVVQLVESTRFDMACGALVVINAGVMGIQVDWMARHRSADAPTIFRSFEKLFCLLFTIEWILRLAAHGRRFFSKQLWGWHAFDTVLVGTQLFEEFMLLSVSGPRGLYDTASPKESNGNGSFGFLRVLRFLRLVRIMRTVRVLRLVGELRTLVLSIIGSLRALVWAMLLLFLFLYVVGIFITQLVLDYRLLKPEASEAASALGGRLEYLFGSLGDTILSVYKGVTGGIDWGDLLEPLEAALGFYIVPLFMLYIAFACLCMLNVITGVFVESALACTKQDNHVFLMSQLKAVFDAGDLDGDHKISAVEFYLSVDTPQIQSVFTQLDLPVKDAEWIFEILDESGDGNLSIEEFVKGCQALASPPKMIDLHAMKVDHEKARAETRKQRAKVESLLRMINDKLDKSVGGRGSQQRDLQPIIAAVVPDGLAPELFDWQADVRQADVRPSQSVRDVPGSIDDGDSWGEEEA